MKMLKLVNKAAYGVLFVGIVTTVTKPTAFAETGRSTYDVLSNYTTLTYKGIYRGAPLARIGDVRQTTAAGTPDPDHPLELDNSIFAGYRYDSYTNLGVLTHFNIFPAGSQDGAHQSFQMLDPAIVLTRASWLNSGSLLVDGQALVHLPLATADFLQRSHLGPSITPAVSATYRRNGSRLSLGLAAYLRGYLRRSDSIPDARTYKVYLAPTLAYQLSSRLAATLYVDLLQVTRNRKTGFFSGAQNDPVDVQPGLSWQISRNVSFNPLLNIYPGNPTLASTSLQAFLVARVI